MTKTKGVRSRVTPKPKPDDVPLADTTRDSALHDFGDFDGAATPVEALNREAVEALRRMRAAVAPKATAETDADPFTSALMALSEVLSHAKNALVGDVAGRIDLTHVLLEEAEGALVEVDPFGELGLYVAGAQLVEAVRLSTTDAKLPRTRNDVDVHFGVVQGEREPYLAGMQLVEAARRGKLAAERRRQSEENPGLAGGIPGVTLTRSPPDRAKPWHPHEHLRDNTTKPDALAKTMRGMATKLRRLGQGASLASRHAYELTRRTLELRDAFAALLAKPLVVGMPENAAQIAKILNVAVHSNPARPAIPIDFHEAAAPRLDRWINAIRDELTALDIQDRRPRDPTRLAQVVLLRVLREQGVKKPSARLDRERKQTRSRRGNPKR